MHVSELYHWLTVASGKWASLGGGHPTPTFMDMPLDVFVNVCEWLSVRDILALRMANKRIARVTCESIIWNSLLRRLFLPLPILPATSKYRFGAVGPRTHEQLLVRALCLEQNWRRRNPVAVHSRFEAGDTTVLMRMLPGGKYMVSVLKNCGAEHYSLVVWDLDHAGRRVALTSATSSTPFLRLEAKYGVVRGSMSIVIAYARPPENAEEGKTTTIVVFSVPIVILEEFARHPPDSASLRAFAASVEFPFTLVHRSTTSCDVGQLVLADFDGELVLTVVHRPRALIFHYLTSGKRGNLLLGPIYPYSDLLHSIWTVKLLTSQNSILVSRVLAEEGIPQDSTLFALDMFVLPTPGTTCKNPAPVGRQLISGLHIDGFYFSDLEASWFASLRDPEGLLPAPVNNEPPPISVFITTKQPRGFVHCLLQPQPIPHQYIQLPYRRGVLRRFAYSLPATKVSRDVWADEYARPVVIPGAYRSIVSMRPHVKLAAVDPVKGTEVLRICTYRTMGEGYDAFATPRGMGSTSTAVGEEMTMQEEAEEEGEEEEEEEEEEDAEEEWCALRVPAIPNSLAWDMMGGTTAMAFDESVGRMCIATSQDTAVHVLDFGGQA